MSRFRLCALTVIFSGATRPGRGVLAVRLHIVCRPLFCHHGSSGDKRPRSGGDEPKVHENRRNKSMRYGHARRVSSVVHSGFQAFYPTLRSSVF